MTFIISVVAIIYLYNLFTQQHKQAQWVTDLQNERKMAKSYNEAMELNRQAVKDFCDGKSDKLPGIVTKE